MISAFISFTAVDKLQLIITARLKAAHFSYTMTSHSSLCALILVWITTQQGECSSKEALFRRNVQKYLANHVMETKQAGSELECGILCVADGSCASVNYKTSGIGKGLCELNSKTLTQETSKADEETNHEFNHLYVIKKVRKFNSFSYIK
jgi:hypothetical protein